MGLLDKLRYAFKIESDEEEFAQEDIALLEKLARGVVKRQLAIPAIMFLESVRPLNFLGAQALTFFQPIANLVISTSEYERFTKILEKRKSISLLIELIEKENAQVTKTEKQKAPDKSL